MAASFKTFKVGVQYHYFIIDGKALQAGQYDYDIDSDGIVRIWNVVTGSLSKTIVSQNWNTIKDDATGTYFASKAALETWLMANFFF